MKKKTTSWTSRTPIFENQTQFACVMLSTIRQHRMWLSDRLKQLRCNWILSRDKEPRGSWGVDEGAGGEQNIGPSDSFKFMEFVVALLCRTRTR